MNNNPDLPNPANLAKDVVSALRAITPPEGNTAEKEHVYFHCTLAMASLHRADGKKLPFIGHFLKTNIREDIAYLDEEVRQQNPYVRRATEEEVAQAKMVEDPVGSIRARVREELSIDELEKLLEERRKAVPQGALDAAKIAAVDHKKSAVLSAGNVTNHAPHAAHTGANTATLDTLSASIQKK